LIQICRWILVTESLISSGRLLNTLCTHTHARTRTHAHTHTRVTYVCSMGDGINCTLHYLLLCYHKWSFLESSGSISCSIPCSIPCSISCSQTPGILASICTNEIQPFMHPPRPYKTLVGKFQGKRSDWVTVRVTYLCALYEGIWRKETNCKHT
jgi:hypothetical protein